MKYRIAAAPHALSDRETVIVVVDPSWTWSPAQLDHHNITPCHRLEEVWEVLDREPVRAVVFSQSFPEAPELLAGLIETYNPVGRIVLVDEDHVDVAGMAIARGTIDSYLVQPFPTRLLASALAALTFSRQRSRARRTAA